MSLEDLAQKYNISRQTVCKRLTYHGYQPTNTSRPRTHDHEKLKKELQILAQNPDMQINQFAKKHKMSEPYVYALAARYGIDIHRRKNIEIATPPPAPSPAPEPTTPVTHHNGNSFVITINATSVPTYPCPVNSICHIQDDGFYIQTNPDMNKPVWQKLGLVLPEKKKNFFFF